MYGVEEILGDLDGHLCRPVGIRGIPPKDEYGGSLTVQPQGLWYIPASDRFSLDVQPTAGLVMVSVVGGGVAHQLGPPDGFLNGSFLPISVAGAVDYSVNAAEQEHNVLTNAE